MVSSRFGRDDGVWVVDVVGLDRCGDHSRTHPFHSHHAEIADFLHTYNRRRRQTLVATIQQGIESGELAHDLDAELAALALIGPIVYRRTMTPDPLSPDQARQVVEIVLGPDADGRNDLAPVTCPAD